MNSFCLWVDKNSDLWDDLVFSLDLSVVEFDRVRHQVPDLVDPNGNDFAD